MAYRVHKKAEVVSQSAIDELQKKLMDVKSQINDLSKAGAEPRTPRSSRKSTITW